MPDIQQSHELGEAATIDIMAAVMVERFGDRAAAVATDQLAAAHACDGIVADHWLSILLSIEDRLNLRKAAAPPAALSPTGRQT